MEAYQTCRGNEEKRDETRRIWFRTKYTDFYSVPIYRGIAKTEKLENEGINRKTDENCTCIQNNEEETGIESQQRASMGAEIPFSL